MSRRLVAEVECRLIRPDGSESPRWEPAPDGVQPADVLALLSAQPEIIISLMLSLRAALDWHSDGDPQHHYRWSATRLGASMAWAGWDVGTGSWAWRIDTTDGDSRSGNRCKGGASSLASAMKEADLRLLAAGVILVGGPRR